MSARQNLWRWFWSSFMSSVLFFSTPVWQIMKLLRILAVPVALFCIGAGLWQLESTTAGLSISRTSVGETPVTVFRAESTASAPVVVIAHGFAGSQQLMQPFAATLARNGFIAVTYDCSGMAIIRSP